MREERLETFSGRSGEASVTPSSHPSLTCRIVVLASFFSVSTVSLTVAWQHVTCLPLPAQVSCLSHIAANYLIGGQEARRWGTAHESIVPYQVSVHPEERLLFVRLEALLFGPLSTDVFPIFFWFARRRWPADPETTFTSKKPFQLFRINHAHSKCLTNHTSSRVPDD